MQKLGFSLVNSFTTITNSRQCTCRYVHGTEGIRVFKNNTDVTEFPASYVAIEQRHAEVSGWMQFLFATRDEYCSRNRRKGDLKGYITIGLS